MDRRLVADIGRCAVRRHLSQIIRVSRTPSGHGGWARTYADGVRVKFECALTLPGQLSRSATGGIRFASGACLRLVAVLTLANPIGTTVRSQLPGTAPECGHQDSLPYGICPTRESDSGPIASIRDADQVAVYGAVLKAMLAELGSDTLRTSKGPPREWIAPYLQRVPRYGSLDSSSTHTHTFCMPLRGSCNYGVCATLRFRPPFAAGTTVVNPWLVRALSSSRRRYTRSPSEVNRSGTLVESNLWSRQTPTRSVFMCSLRGFAQATTPFPRGRSTYSESTDATASGS